MGFFTWRAEVVELLTAIKTNQINLTTEVSKMATAQQITDAVTAIKASIDAAVAKINDLKTTGVNPTDLDAPLASLEAAKTELDAATQ
jgi:hypothetical protein